MKILMFTRYTIQGASSRLRLFQYIPYLKENGFEVTVEPLLNDIYLEKLYSGNRIPIFIIFKSYFRRVFILLKCKEYSLLCIEKELFPWLPSWAERILSLFKIPYIVDYDDAIFHNYDLNKNAIIRYTLKGKIKNIMKGAVMVIAGNEYIAKYAKKAGAIRIEIIPTVIDLNKYHITHRKPKAVFTIGWIGSPSTAKFLKIVEHVLSEFCKVVPSRILLIGSGPLSLGEIPLEIRLWSETKEVSDIQSFDIGIMPLDNGPWEQGKCGYKLIQYMACGIPVISSNVGINKEIVDEGLNGFLVNKPEEWMKALKTLYDNPELRVKFGEAGRKKVETKYSIQVTSPVIGRFFMEAANQTMVNN